MALQLKRYGITRVHPLLGGVHLWLELRYPVDRKESQVSASAAIIKTAPTAGA